jgi:hypothetical protein
MNSSHLSQSFGQDLQRSFMFTEPKGQIILQTPEIASGCFVEFLQERQKNSSEHSKHSEEQSLHSCPDLK